MIARRLLSGVCLFASVVFAAAPARAETLFGVYAGVAQWHQNSAGSIASGGATVDTKQDLALGDTDNRIWFLALEHPIPFVPNLKVQRMDASLDGRVELLRTLELNGVTFDPPGEILSNVSLRYDDAILYYNVLDTGVHLDLGLVARKLEGSAYIYSGNEFSKISFDAVLPMLYASSRVEVLNGYWFGLEGMGVMWQGDTFMDVTAEMGWRSKLGLGLEVGYRYTRFRVSSLGDIDKARLTVEGPFASLSYRY
ncbi:MAG: TIGR04219 family outer membrane beta-barrel protein [Pseudomonadales bacterium]|nr:TIGR04219 family outer membrane beta-barrel protein [Pseudomonadales bacterium]MCP5186044.1 TIGR04219 family outer membrane beta-barrel protein [Pseudomonadales bacterium]